MENNSRYNSDEFSEVKLVIIDTPINKTHEFMRDTEIIQKGSIKESDHNRDYVHGTHVAGIVKQTISNFTKQENLLQILSLPAMNITIPIHANDKSYANIEVFYGPNGKCLSGLGTTNQALIELSNSDVKVANLSLGIHNTNREAISVITPVLKKLRMQGCVLVVAAGNQGIDLDVRKDSDLLLSFQNYEFSVEVDGKSRTYKMDNIVFVGASNHAGHRTISSNFGTNTVALYAPGEDILSCTSLPNCMERKSGTGQAAPRVAATLALLVSRFPTASHDQLIQHLLQTSEMDINGERHLNIQRALESNLCSSGQSAEEMI